MKFSVSIVAASVAAFAGAAVAEDCVSLALKVIPSCAQTCFLNGAPSIGCGGTDFQCQCKNQAKLMAAVESCVKKSCPSESYQAVIDGGNKTCACAAALSPSAQGSGTVAPTVTGTAAPTTSVVKPTNVPTAAANRPAVGVMAGVLGFAAIAL